MMFFFNKKKIWSKFIKVSQFKELNLEWFAILKLAYFNYCLNTGCEFEII